MSITKKLQTGVYNGVDDYDVTGLPSIALMLETAVPFVSLSQAEGRGVITTASGKVYNLSKKSVDASQSLDAKATVRVCGLSVELAPGTTATDVDDNGDLINPDYTGVYDRYHTVALMESIITKREMVLVYDKVEGSFFVMPPVYNLVDSVAGNVAGSHTITISGYYVGRPQGNKKELRSGVGQEVNANYELVSTAELATTTHVMETQIYGSNMCNFEAAGIMLDGSNYMESTNVPSIELVSLGASASLVAGGKVSVSKIMKVNGSIYHPFELGKVSLSDLLIPLYV